MKKALLAVGALISVSVMAKTVILYDDGTQYTVESNEKVYVSDYSQLYHFKQWGDGDIDLRRVSKNPEWIGRKYKTPFSISCLSIQLPI